MITLFLKRDSCSSRAGKAVAEVKFVGLRSPWTTTTGKREVITRFRGEGDCQIWGDEVERPTVTQRTRAGLLPPATYLCTRTGWIGLSWIPTTQRRVSMLVTSHLYDRLCVGVRLNSSPSKPLLLG